FRSSHTTIQQAEETGIRIATGSDPIPEPKVGVSGNIVRLTGGDGISVEARGSFRGLSIDPNDGPPGGGNAIPTEGGSVLVTRNQVDGTGSNGVLVSRALVGADVTDNQ